MIKLIGLVILMIIALSIKIMKSNLEEKRQNLELDHQRKMAAAMDDFEKRKAQQTSVKEVTKSDKEIYSELLTDMRNLDLMTDADYNRLSVTPIDLPRYFENNKVTPRLILKLIEDTNKVFVDDADRSRIPVDYATLFPFLLDHIESIKDNYQFDLEYSQQQDADDLYLLKLQIDNKSFEKNARDFKDYFDIESVKEFINGVLEYKSITPPFVNIDTDDTSYFLVRGNKHNIKELFTKYDLSYWGVN